MKNFIITLATGLSLALATGTAYASGSERHAGSERGQVEQEIRGTIQSLPQGEIGIWDIDGKQVEVTQSTRIEEKHGKAEVGALVEVEGIASGNTISARKIEVKRKNH